MKRQRVVIVTLGGTISMTAGPEGSVRPSLRADALSAAIPGIGEIAELDFRDHRLVPGCELNFEDYQDLAMLIHQSQSDGAQGVVIVQGTDTLEETAFALDLLYRGEIPVVLTGAMRSPAQTSPDGPLNLSSAVRVAASGDFRRSGVVVVMAEEVHAARYVTKAHCSHGAAFVSVNGGRVGYLSEEHAVLLSRLPILPISIKGIKAPQETPVALLKICAGDDGRLIRALPDLGFNGLVVEAMGAGHVPVACAEEIGLLANCIPVVLSSRTGSGEVFAKTYGFPGSETDLVRRGAIRSGWLDGLKSRIALTLLLQQQAGRNQISEFFQAFGGGLRDYTPILTVD